ncbi:hypothetical protein TPHA_0K01880 [Tetrapisispora phaffii CBS 4417]|uniref:Phosphatidylethanolamine N-methyltransferase n=1 Tax=Tetrapisispora phaffii (strain ATCC 24235 / CBS 4417 / NBRC 1672 / NRRL Y-8282 / UCD 70-5) TaxID=1071381 RepID=G8BZJ2_TETPH|nr:hypothetical protein TPHA_0K01880 [Tetrapisispora phaffii CBS 4417]CCE65320.1 hypothetical protein TPHA_0K01880 [Tetrapisispora phaffii CBS 4417]
MSNTIEIESTSKNSSKDAADKSKKLIARTRSSGVSFNPPVTHDMVRSLFDPTLKKSFLEICITLTIILNFILAYYMVKFIGLSYTKLFYLCQYVIWRLGYNFGIGYILHNQSNYESLTNFANDRKLFDKKEQKNSLLSRFAQFEINSKLEGNDSLYSYPTELNVWLLFRQFVDLILMQDFSTYIIYVYLSFPNKLNDYYNFNSFLGLMMILFNVWVKLDAHRVVKDYAWYWGDFFFLQDTELTFDGVFNISPHPMYSIGYLGYYGLSLICNDYRVLLVSIWGHFLQFLFLKYVENPHIEKIYGVSNDTAINSNIDDLISKEHYDYSRPLISTGIYFQNFQYLRFTDYFTVSTVIVLISWFLMSKPSNTFLFYFTMFVKLVTWSGISMILYQQSHYKWFTKLFLKNGYTQIYSYQNWQFIYSFTLVVNNTLLFCQTLGKLATLYPFSQLYSKIIFGILLCCLQIWCNGEIRDAISDFGWFYGDFFLTNYITSRKLSSRGIYRYLNNPEAILGVAGIWGTVLMTDFCHENIILAVEWTLTNFIFVKYIEQPHVAKVYGNSVRISGVSKTLLALKPIKSVTSFVDIVSNKMMHSLSYLDSDSETEHNTSDTDSVSSGDKDIFKFSKYKLEHNNTDKISPNSEFKVEGLQNDINLLPNKITVSWKLPASIYNEKSWIGLYNVLDVGNDRLRTRVSSMNHWSATSKSAYPHNPINSASVSEFQKTGSSFSGKVVFDASLLHFKPGIYELRFHGNSSHKVLMISRPFQLGYPKLELESREDIKKALTDILTKCGSVKDGKYVESANKNFPIIACRKLIKDSLDVELSIDYIRRVNGDLDTISTKIHEIKVILEKL